MVGLSFRSNWTTSGSDKTVVHIDNSSLVTVHSFNVSRPRGHGIHIENSEHVFVQNGLINEYGREEADTYHGVLVETSDNCRISDVSFTGDAASAVTVASGENNILVGNAAYGSYSTAAYVDTATNTQTTYPNDPPPVGDNF